MKITLRYFPGLLLAGLLSLAGFGAAQAQEVDAVDRPGIADMLDEVTGAVVNVAVTGTVDLPENPLYNDPFFRRFFGIPEGQQMPQQRQTMSVGSGVIIDADQGYVLTNHHVIADADEIRITMRDRRNIPAELIGSDPRTDIALLQVEAENLTEIPIGDSDTLEVGDYVVAIGNPFGIGQTVTSGIVSALSRSTGILMQEEGYEDFIQTDASINPGNSGGALVDFTGHLVGINTAIIAPTGGNVGIGFAVPINMARNVVDQLIEFGEVQRGLLGVLIQDLTPDLAQVLELDVNRGAVVSEVQQGSAAAEAGIQAGDVIIELNGQDIGGMQELRNTVGLMRPGTEVEVTLVRDGERQTLDVTLKGQQTEQREAPQVAEASVLDGAELAEAEDGVRVTSVVQGSPAWNNRLRQGDVILEVNRQPVDSPSEVREILQDSPGDTAAVRVRREGQTLFLVLR